MKFRKRPLVVEAHQTDKVVEIATLNGVVTAVPGDWIITDVKGRQYPCNREVFEETYEPVDEEELIEELRGLVKLIMS